MKYANQISEIINAFSPAPLNMDQMDEFYCKGTMEYRTSDKYDSPIEDIFDSCRDSEERAAFLLLGHRGCGKSTELNHMSQKLISEGYYVKTIVCGKDLFLFDIVYSDLFILLGEALLEIAEESGCELDENLLNDIRNFWNEGTETRTWTESGAISCEAGTGVQNGGILKGILNIFAAIKADLKLNEETRKEYSRKNKYQTKTFGTFFLPKFRKQEVSMNKNRKKNTVTESAAEGKLKGFLDMIAPSVIQFNTDHYICGNTYRSVWALREYPTATDEQAILRHLGEKDGVTLRIYTRQVTPAEEKKIISNAANKNRMKQGNTENLQKTVTAASNLQDVTTIIATMHRNREPLLHTAVFIELSAPDMDKLKLLQTEVLTELIRSKLNVDKLLLRQKQGFLCVHPVGRNVFREQFERALPASSVANLFPFNYSGKTDKNGFYIGRDKFGSNVIVDFNQRADDKTNANILILGNSGQGKSYLLKLILTILRESGMKVICLDPEHEYIDLTNNLGGCFVDLMSGEFIINVLEPKTWDENGSPEDMDAPMAFQCSSKLSQHISFLKDFFRTYKNFTDSQIDTIEIMLGK